MRLGISLRAVVAALCTIGYGQAAFAASIEYLDASPIALSANGRHVLLGNVQSDRIEPPSLLRYTLRSALFDLEDRELVLVESPDPQDALQAMGLSADGGTVYGIRNAYSLSIGGPSLFRWRGADDFEALERPGEEVYRFLSAIDGSRDGSILVGATTGLGFESARSFVWDAQGRLEPFMAWGAGPLDQALAISDEGDVFAGETRVEMDGSLIRVATRWTAANGAERLIPDTIAASSSSATVLSGDGKVVFGTYRTSAVEFERVFVSDDQGMFEDLGALLPEAFRASLAAATWDGGRAVGRAESFGLDANGLVSGFPSDAVLWDRARGARKISELLVGLGVDLRGATLVDAIDISADGTRILGRTSDGFAFIATIPEPGPSVLLLLGLAGLAALARRERQSNGP